MPLINFQPDEPVFVRYNLSSVPGRFSVNELAPGESLPEGTHWHNEVTFLRVLKGRFLAEMSSRTFEACEGDVLVINSRQPHILSCGEKTGCVWQTLFLDLYNFCEAESIQTKLLHPVFFRYQIEGYLIPRGNSQASAICECLDRIALIKEAPFDGCELELMSLLYNMLSHVYSFYSSCDFSSLRRNEGDSINNMLDFILRFYSRKILLEDIAKAGNVCRSRCCRLFRTYLNLSPVDFLNSYRLSVSRDRLVNTEDTIAVIASECGFAHQSYYTKLFSAKYGCTPNEYRLMHRGASVTD